MKTQFRCLMFIAVVLLATPFVLRAGPVLVGNNGFAGQTLDDDSIKAVLLGKKATIGNTRVVIVLAKTSDNQDNFLNAHIGMTTDQFQTYCRRLYMTGGGSAPKTADTEADACKLVAETPGAIAIGDSTKVAGLAVLAAK